ncbi:hypothetical protein [Paenibacillus sp. WLX2291]|uniref:hypothetical protein n=1 Tax=Paenibacillus sp. WLX2291 TaxID=3296934 RepID=UPI00398445C8
MRANAIRANAIRANAIRANAIRANAIRANAIRVIFKMYCDFSILHFVQSQQSLINLISYRYYLHFIKL